MIRELKIINNIGQEYNLNDTNLFGYDPSGLGLSFSNGYIATGTSFIPTVQTLNQGQLSLNLLFGAIQENAYVTFYDFVNFLNYQPYTLVYNTDAGDFQRVCQLSAITKSEIKIGKAIDENMVLDYITPWYTYHEGSTDLESTLVYDQIGDGKIYNYIGSLSRTVFDYIGDPQFDDLFRSNGTYWKCTFSSDRQYLSKPSQVQIPNYKVVKYDSRRTEYGTIYYYDFEFNYYPQNMNNLPSDYGTVMLEMTFNLSSNYNNHYLDIYPMDANGNFVPCIVADNRGKVINNKLVEYHVSNSVNWFTVKIVFLKNSTTPTLRRIYFKTDYASVVMMTAPKLLVETQEDPPPPEPEPEPPVEPEDPPPPAYVPSQPYSSPRPHHLYSYIYEEEDPIPIDNQFTIVNNSKLFNQDINSPILIEIEALSEDVVNPYWEVYYDGDLVASDGYILTIPVGGRLIVSSFPDNQYAILYDAEYIMSNVYQYQDMTKTGFVTLKQGVNDVSFHVGTGIVNYKLREEHLIV